jgi:hypothetical protein
MNYEHWHWMGVLFSSLQKQPIPIVEKLENVEMHTQKRFKRRKIGLQQTHPKKISNHNDQFSMTC